MSVNFNPRNLNPNNFLGFDGPYLPGTVSNLAKQMYLNYDVYSNHYNPCEVECTIKNTSQWSIETCKRVCKNFN